MAVYIGSISEQSAGRQGEQERQAGESEAVQAGEVPMVAGRTRYNVGPIRCDLEGQIPSRSRPCSCKGGPGTANPNI